MTTYSVGASGADFTSIQDAIDASTAGDNIIVFAGTYNESINVNKDVTLQSLDGAATTVINGQNTNNSFSFSVFLGADGATFGTAGHGFTVNAGAEEAAAVYVDHDDIKIEGNVINGSAAAATHHLSQALLGGGGIDNVVITGNTFGGTADQLVYMNGERNSTPASSNVNFINNVFSGTSLGAHLVLDASSSTVSGNTFSGPGEAALVLQQPGNTIGTNNIFTSFNGLDILTADTTFSLSGYSAHNLAAQYAATGVDFTGNDLDNEITGNSTDIPYPSFNDDFDDTLSGLGGNDTLTGLGGEDTLTGGVGADTIDGGDGDDTILYTIGDGVDTVDGGAGDDELNVFGTAGDDVVHVAIAAGLLSSIEGFSPESLEHLTVDGLGGSDTLDYSGSPSAATVNLTVNTASGFDPGQVQGIENVIGSATADSLTGDGNANVLRGGGGNDTVDGAGGDDTIVFRVGDGSDVIVGGNGTDTLSVLGTTGIDVIDVHVVSSKIDVIEGLSPTTLELYTADGAAGVDTLSYAGTSQGVAVDLLAGTATGFSAITGIENVIGGSGKDTFTGNASSNTFTGGLGNDTYTLGTGDKVVEAANEGTDTIVSAITRSLASFANVENLTLTGSAKINGTGNAANNVIKGNSGANTLDGGDGGDILTGGAGRDILTGGKGRDVLTGGADRDIFDFNSTTESKVGASNRDIINDFHHGNNTTGDDIDLRSIDAKTGAGNQAFTFIGTQAFHHVKGELHFKDLGSQVLIEGDTNGNGTADFQILVKVGTIGASDFLL